MNVQCHTADARIPSSFFARMRFSSARLNCLALSAHKTHRPYSSNMSSSRQRFLPLQLARSGAAQEQQQQQEPFGRVHQHTEAPATCLSHQLSPHAAAAAQLEHGASGLPLSGSTHQQQQQQQPDGYRRPPHYDLPSPAPQRLGMASASHHQQQKHGQAPHAAAHAAALTLSPITTAKDLLRQQQQHGQQQHGQQQPPSPCPTSSLSQPRDDHADDGDHAAPTTTTAAADGPQAVCISSHNSSSSGDDDSDDDAGPSAGGQTAPAFTSSTTTSLLRELPRVSARITSEPDMMLLKLEPAGYNEAFRKSIKKMSYRDTRRTWDAAAKGWKVRRVRLDAVLQHLSADGFQVEKQTQTHIGAFFLQSTSSSWVAAGAGAGAAAGGGGGGGRGAAAAAAASPQAVANVPQQQQQYGSSIQQAAAAAGATGSASTAAAPSRLLRSVVVSSGSASGSSLQQDSDMVSLHPTSVLHSAALDASMRRLPGRQVWQKRVSDSSSGGLCRWQVRAFKLRQVVQHLQQDGFEVVPAEEEGRRRQQR